MSEVLNPLLLLLGLLLLWFFTFISTECRASTLLFRRSFKDKLTLSWSISKLCFQDDTHCIFITFSVIALSLIELNQVVKQRSFFKFLFVADKNKKKYLKTNFHLSRIEISFAFIYISLAFQPKFRLFIPRINYMHIFFKWEHSDEY